MELKKAIMSRRSIRNYQNIHIRDEDLQEILDAGMWAPSAVNFQPWYLVAVRSQEQMHKLLRVMAQVSEDIKPALQERFQSHPEVINETTGFIRQLGGAPICILAFQLKPNYPKTDSTIVQSVAAALENLILAATAKGIGSCWLTAPVETGVGPMLRDMFAPGKGDLVAIVTLGYSAQEPNVPSRKEGRYTII